MTELGKGASLFALTVLLNSSATAEDFVLVFRNGPMPFNDLKTYVRSVTGYDTPIARPEHHNKHSEVTGSYNPSCPWTAPWATRHSTNEEYYLGYSGGGVVPAGKVYHWYYTYKWFIGQEKWSRVEDGLTMYYERSCFFDGDISELKLEIVDTSVPPGEGS